MKKSLIIIWICIILVALVGCGDKEEEVTLNDSIQNNALQASGSDIQTRELLSFPDVANMFDPCSQLAAYMAVTNEQIDMQRPSTDDFWLIMSMVTYAADPDVVGEFGTIDLKENEVRDIAEAFFSDMLKSSEIPSPKETYSAAYVAAEQIYELQPMSISGIDTELVSLEKDEDTNGRYIMKIRVFDEQDPSTMSDWYVYLDEWNDSKEHYFPYKFVKAWYTT